MTSLAAIIFWKLPMTLQWTNFSLITCHEVCLGSRFKIQVQCIAKEKGVIMAEKDYSRRRDCIVNELQIWLPVCICDLILEWIGQQAELELFSHQFIKSLEHAVDKLSKRLRTKTASFATLMDYTPQ